MNRTLELGIISGGGTARELIECINFASQVLGENFGLNISLKESPNVYKTFYDIQHLPSREVDRVVKDEAEKLLADYRSFAENVHAVFRTAINAETLYLVRAKTLTVKPQMFSFGKTRILFIRDETQGFYAPEDVVCKDKQATVVSRFGRDNFESLIGYARSEAQRAFGKTSELWAVYKHHCVGNVISKWVHGIDNEAIVIQPNDATERVFELIEKSAEKDITIIAGNEVGDLFFEVLSRFSNGRGRTQECSVDVLLHRDYRNLHVYQTVHGSVDILKGKQEVNPTATLHALARILEKHAGVHNAVNSLFDAVCNLQDRGIKTADFGGNVSTMEFARRVINEWQIEP